MPTPAERIAFCERNIVTKEGDPWSVDGRDWVRTELFEPADGWRLWPRNVEKLCDECRAKAGDVVAWSRDLEGAKCKAGCMGLSLEPIMLTILNLPRREGKTVNVMGYNLSTIFLEQRKFITYVASAGHQTRTLFEENYAIPIRANPKLVRRSVIRGEHVTVTKTKSKLEVVETSHGSITGRGRTHVIIDEARDVPARVISALLPSMRDQNGLACPAGHVRARFGPRAPKNCSVCGLPLEPWYGRVIIISSSGMLESSERDWFDQLVEQQLAKPHPNVHLYKSDESCNPAVSVRSTKMLGEVFGELDAMRDYMEVELTNVSRRKGEDFVTARQLAECVDADLLNLEGDPAPCVGFLDTSISKDLTSLVVVSQDELRSQHPWEDVFVSRLDLWEPKLQPRGIIDAGLIVEHLDRYVPLFPGLVELLVDVRAMPWARDMVIDLRASRSGWGKRIAAFHGHTKERDLGWAVLEQRMLAGKIRFPDHPRLLDEIKGVRRVTRTDGTIEIRDRARKKRHADLAEGLATCCYRIYLEQTRPRASMLMTSVGRRRSGLPSIGKTYGPITRGFDTSSL